MKLRELRPPRRPFAMATWIRDWTVAAIAIAALLLLWVLTRRR